MKTLLILLVSILLFSNCRKDVSACKEYKQLVPEKPVDLNAIDVPEFKEYLSQYSYLQPYEFSSEAYLWIMKCHVICKGLPVLTDQYNIIKRKSDNQVIVTDTLRTYDLPLSTEPAVSYTDAIREAKKIMNFDHTCIRYSLGIYNTRLYGPYHPTNYVLVWKIEGEKKSPFVILNATTKEIYRSTDGIILN